MQFQILIVMQNNILRAQYNHTKVTRELYAEET